MKGVMFNILEGFVTERYGDEAYEQLLASAKLATSEAFVAPRTYPDQDMFALVGAASALTGLPVPALLQAFGRYAFPELARRYPVFMKGHKHPKSFLRTIDAVIHVEVRKLMSDAHTPEILCEERPEGFVVTYRSPRKLCPLMQGLLEGVADYFEIEMECTHPRCMLHGAPRCEFVTQFARVSETADPALPELGQVNPRRNTTP